jgi:ABC-type transport system involved in multi-copper enzyme maturation permease subunit
MIRLSLLQFRIPTITAAVALTLLGVVLAITGPDVAQHYASSGLATCATVSACGPLSVTFFNEVNGLAAVLYFAGIVFMLLAPALIGVFWGAPLIAREMETGTLALAWTQSVTRLRWLVVKLGLAGLVAMGTAGLLSLMLTWWSSPIDDALSVPYGNRVVLTQFSAILFAGRDITPVGYAAFAFALGVTAGIVIRRTVPAMAVTLGVFTVVQFAWSRWIRAQLIAPLHATVALNTADIVDFRITGNVVTSVQALPSLSQQNTWILSSRVVNAAGQPFTAPATKGCLGGNFQACQAYLGRLHPRQVVTYQPASHFWPLQWTETGIFVALALLLAGICAWRIQRHRDSLGQRCDTAALLGAAMSHGGPKKGRE